MPLSSPAWARAPTALPGQAAAAACRAILPIHEAPSSRRQRHSRCRAGSGDGGGSGGSGGERRLPPLDSAAGVAGWAAASFPLWIAFGFAILFAMSTICGNKPSYGALTLVRVAVVVVLTSACTLSRKNLHHILASQEPFLFLK